MTTLTGAKQGVFRRRDLFVHDGSHLRRISLTAPVQAAMAVLLLFVVGWSAFATARMVTASPTAVPKLLSPPKSPASPPPPRNALPGSNSASS
ncbi:hypothetical protein H9L12_00665 [Sphingomonas rhizophila]|uniref:Uncharacterized protein n=1 Tax=Sphingomonas rhizophila TaxID=2071607 RepID=A0A7G9SBI1_9SPHN|nr:hypothetical protein [Sphingomonas rhizophila]QNN65206.1 hypothetical protein H9L12_00665 [Sphingomonas rhizophila]